MATRNPIKIDAVPGRQEILMTSEINAPRDRVFRAFTDPTLYTQ